MQALIPLLIDAAPIFLQGAARAAGPIVGGAIANGIVGAFQSLGQRPEEGQQRFAQTAGRIN